ncbi:KTSC domain-containing protein [Chitinophagaceae bacterium 26-R-25]|nr:KTSC domain-containing protein [Chitinophagaceae bacterium 26-R-25]
MPFPTQLSTTMTTNDAKNILGITQGRTSLNDLKKIFKKLMLQWHPDIAINKGISAQEATSTSQQIILAYEILSENLDSLDEVSMKYTYQSYYQYKTSTKKSYKQYYDHSIDGIDASFVNRITVKSSNVKWVDYIRDLQILVVRFKRSSGYYLYYDVPESIFERFRMAESPGRFVYQYLHGYKYESYGEYADWLNVYKSLSEITEDKNGT